MPTEKAIFCVSVFSIIEAVIYINQPNHMASFLPAVTCGIKFYDLANQMGFE